MGSMQWFQSGPTHTFSERPRQEGPGSRIARSKTPGFENNSTLNQKSMPPFGVDRHGIVRPCTSQLELNTVKDGATLINRDEI